LRAAFRPRDGQAHAPTAPPAGRERPSEAGFEINPAKSARVSFDSDDRVIVLAED